MGINKKIKNASAKEYNGIKFKSTLEASIYKRLIQLGITPEYEKHTFVLWDGFVPTIPFYTKNVFKRKDYRIKVISLATVQDTRPLTSITYTPDFYFEYNGKKIVIEAKGFVNDVFPYKFKMFKGYLEQQPDKDSYEIWEIFTIKQLLECVNLLQHSDCQ